MNSFMATGDGENDATHRRQLVAIPEQTVAAE